MRQMHGTLETNKNLDHDHEAVACSRHVPNYFLTCLIHTTSGFFCALPLDLAYITSIYCQVGSGQKTYKIREIKREMKNWRIIKVSWSITIIFWDQSLKTSANFHDFLPLPPSRRQFLYYYPSANLANFWPL